MEDCEIDFYQKSIVGTWTIMINGDKIVYHYDGFSETIRSASGLVSVRKYKIYRANNGRAAISGANGPVPILAMGDKYLIIRKGRKEYILTRY